VVKVNFLTGEVVESTTYQPPYRLLICGDREWTDEKAIEAIIDCYRAFPPGMECLIHGNCRGADRIAGKIAKAKGIKVLAFPADWDRHGPKAGAMRNRQMLNEGHPNLVIGFHNHISDSKGTKDMLQAAQKAGINAFLASTIEKSTVDNQQQAVEDEPPDLPW
jgi:hypothetical protein